MFAGGGQQRPIIVLCLLSGTDIMLGFKHVCCCDAIQMERMKSLRRELTGTDLLKSHLHMGMCSP